MISKLELLEYSIDYFTKFGSKSFTMDELANKLGISKKTIYYYFNNKEELVTEGLCFSYLNSFKPSFIFGLKKYYPKANAVFEAFRDDVVNHKVRNLLEEAQRKKIIQQDVKIDLMCELYFLRVENIAFKQNNLFDKYATDVLLKHLIVNNLRGIVTTGYSNRIFER